MTTSACHESLRNKIIGNKPRIDLHCCGRSILCHCRDHILVRGAGGDVKRNAILVKERGLGKADFLELRIGKALWNRLLHCLARATRASTRGSGRQKGLGNAGTEHCLLLLLFQPGCLSRLKPPDQAFYNPRLLAKCGSLVGDVAEMADSAILAKVARPAELVIAQLARLATSGRLPRLPHSRSFPPRQSGGGIDTPLPF
eukprot:jgi/Mesvir1/27964/Mv25890-RA.1